MRMAIDLARKGYPAPNPRVGCVLVKDNEVVGKGWHDFAGGDHAEVAAIKDAGEKAKGTTAYVTLEPCNHTGRTGPCSEALIAAGVSRVVFAVKDPFKHNEISGEERLREAGIAVESGLLEAEAREINEVFLFAHANKRPYIALKMAMTVDGFARPTSGQWITTPESRHQGRLLRAEYGAVLVGAETVIIDDPMLTVRDPEVKNEPKRIILDPSARVSRNLRVFEHDDPTIHFVGKGFAKHDDDIELPLEDGKFNLQEVLGKLYEMGIIGVLVEGGPSTAQRFLREGLADLQHWFIASTTRGGSLPWLEREPYETDWHEISRKSIGPDIWITLRPNRYSKNV